MSEKQDVKFLQTHLKQSQELYEHFNDVDFVADVEDDVEKEARYKAQLKEFDGRELTEDEAEDKTHIQKALARHKQQLFDRERIAQLADRYGFDGSMFRKLLNDEDLAIVKLHLKKEIKTISKLIAEIEKPVDKSVIPDGAKLVKVEQLARMLQIADSEVYARTKKGLIPKPVRTDGLLQWDKEEIELWIKAGMPPVDKWEKFKESNADRRKRARGEVV